jgi:hypothetical protein
MSDIVVEEGVRISRHCVCRKMKDGSIKQCAAHSLGRVVGYPKCEHCGDKGYIDSQISGVPRGYLRRDLCEAPGCEAAKSVPLCAGCTTPVFRKKGRVLPGSLVYCHDCYCH